MRMGCGTICWCSDMIRVWWSYQRGAGAWWLHGVGRAAMSDHFSPILGEHGTSHGYTEQLVSGVAINRLDCAGRALPPICGEHDAPPDEGWT